MRSLWLVVKFLCLARWGAMRSFGQFSIFPLLAEFLRRRECPTHAVWFDPRVDSIALIWLIAFAEGNCRIFSSQNVPFECWPDPSRAVIVPNIEQTYYRTWRGNPIEFLFWILVLAPNRFTAYKTWRLNFTLSLPHHTTEDHTTGIIGWFIKASGKTWKKLNDSSALLCTFCG